MVRAEIAKIYWISVWLPSCHVKQTYQAQPYLLRFVLEGKLHACSCLRFVAQNQHQPATENAESGVHETNKSSYII